MDINSNESKDKNVNNGVQVLNKIISLNHQPITILVPNTNNDINNNIKEEPNNQRKKIPRPANAFMIFANENRRKVAKMHPLESNKEISIRLGTQWKNLSPTLKDKYFAMAKEVDDDHKRKYPDYVYNPKEARIRKALRDRERSIVNSSTARSRRSNWSRQSPAPQMPPIAHATDPHMNIPSKEFRSVIRHELEHGFLHNNGGYIYPSQQYLFTPQSEYMSYINAIPSTNWPPNTYNMQNNNMVQQQIWNQYQADRVRSQQQQQQQQHQQQNQNYMLNAQGPPQQQQQQQQSDYQIEQHMSQHQQMGPTPPTKSRMQQNIENAASDVDRYLNIPNGNARNQNQNQLDQMQMISNPNTNTNTNGSCISEDSVISSESNQRSSQGSTSNQDVSISMPDASTIHLDNSDNAETGFVGGIQLFNEDVSNTPNIENRTNKELIKQEPCTSSHNNNNNNNIPIPPPTYESMVPNPYFQMELLQTNTNKQYVRSFLPSNTSYFIEYPNAEPQMIKKQEIPLNYSAQKYYESVSNGNFDVPIIPNGGFVCDDGGGYSFVILNQSDIQVHQPAANYSYLPNQLEVNQFLSDPCDMIPVNMDSSKNDNDCILDLSKEAESEQEIDVGEENCSLDKFMDVSNRICEELSKIS